MANLGGLLTGILGSINPANIVKGIVNTATGVLDNISKGAPLDISGNLARGLKTAMGESTSAIGSIGGEHKLEPSVQEKLEGTKNASNIFNVDRMNRIMGDLTRSRQLNAANLRGGVWSEDRTRTGQLGTAPAKDMGESEYALETAPGGMPDRRITLVHSGMRKAPAVDLLNARDQYGYKSIPVVMQGYSDTSIPSGPTGLNTYSDRLRLPKAPRKRKAKRKGKK